MSKAAQKSYYYDIRDDIKRYPEAVFIFVYGGRGTGKTYSGLRTVTEDKTKFVFIKRTLEDVKMLCGSNRIGVVHKEDDEVPLVTIDTSPFKPLNRDFGWNIQPFQTYPGLGGFFSCDNLNNPYGEAKGYIAALSGIGKIKGYDMSDCDVMIFDEFCPKDYERISTHEDTEILDMYKTVARDREHRGKPPLKFWAFANADDAVCPLIEAFGLINQLAEMVINHQEYYYNPETKVLLHKLRTSDEFMSVEANSAIYKAAAPEHPWVKMALANEFSNNDFSMIMRKNMKNMICEAHILYRGKSHFVYYDAASASRYVTYSNYNKEPLLFFNLDRIIDQRPFVEYARNKVLQVWTGSEKPAFQTFDLQTLYFTAKDKFAKK